MPITLIDQMNREIQVPNTPQRIISLVPSQTELLIDLGLEDQLIGITKFCIHPAGLTKKKQIIGGTKKFRFEAIDALQPDLIIGNKEENYQEGIEQLAQKYPVWMSDIVSLEDAFQMMLAIGEMTHTTGQAQALVDQIRQNFQQLPKFPKQKALYFIWRKPYMLAGRGTFIHTLMEMANLENVIQGERYPALEIEALQALQPDTVLLSSEPYPFKKKHLEELQEIFPKANIQLVDGELFSWYGSRLLHTPAYFKVLFNQ
ncbi:MAG: ABC transporter substrate-binding protein [Flammeovirgaceae bacterium]